MEPDWTGPSKGTATYRERIALPPGAVFEATLEDVSKAGAKADVKIDPGRRYAVRARILVGTRLLYTTDPVLTAGKGNEVTLMLRGVGSLPSTASLENTYWKLPTWATSRSPSFVGSTSRTSFFTRILGERAAPAAATGSPAAMS